jgi:hypothetical protein
MIHVVTLFGLMLALIASGLTLTIIELRKECRLRRGEPYEQRGPS